MPGSGEKAPSSTTSAMDRRQIMVPPASSSRAQFDGRSPAVPPGHGAVIRGPALAKIDHAGLCGRLVPEAARVGRRRSDAARPRPAGSMMLTEEALARDGTRRLIYTS